jgi:hypothetical protein
MLLNNKKNNILVSKFQTNKQTMMIKSIKPRQNITKSMKQINKSNNRYDINQIKFLKFN